MPEHDDTAVECLLPQARVFTNREAELKVCRETIKSLEHSIRPHHVVLNFFGVPGIGKTALLARYEEIARKQGNLSVVVLDFAKAYSQNQNWNKASHDVMKNEFVRLLIQACVSIDLDVPSLVDSTDQLDGSDVDTFVSELIRLLIGRSQERPLLLLIDGWEYIDDTLFEWLERWMVASLVQRGRVLCIFGSQAPLRWRSFETRERTRAFELKPLSEGATREQIGLYDIPQAALFELTHGLPLANETAFSVLGTSSSPQVLLNDQERGALLREFIATIRERIVVSLTDDLWHAIRVTSLFREFDATTLNAVLPQIEPVFTYHNLTMMMQVIRQLVETRLFRWHDYVRAFEFEPTMRSLFAEEIRLNDPQFFERVHWAAASYYQALVEDAPRGRGLYLTEFYYHEALYNHPSDLYNEQSIRKHLEHVIRTYYASPDLTYVDEWALDELEQLLRKDKELQDVLSKRGFAPNLLISTIEDFRSIYRDVPPSAS